MYALDQLDLIHVGGSKKNNSQEALQAPGEKMGLVQAMIYLGNWHERLRECGSGILLCDFAGLGIIWHCHSLFTLAFLEQNRRGFWLSQ